MYSAIYVYDFRAHSSKLSSQLLHAGTEELLHTPQIQTTLYTKVSGTMRSLAGRGYYFSLTSKGVSISIAGACMRFGRAGSGSEFGTDQSRIVGLLPLSLDASAILQRCCWLQVGEGPGFQMAARARRIAAASVRFTEGTLLTGMLVTRMQCHPNI
jgi:hypothetical protein